MAQDKWLKLQGLFTTFDINIISMSAILIKADNKSNRILKELARQLGANVVSLKDGQYEDFLLGTIIESEKTGTDVKREEVFKKLRRK
jgi:hypothetical protein